MSESKIPLIKAYESPSKQSIDRRKLKDNRDPIGSGGQGEVYRVNLSSDDTLPKHIAVKEPVASAETIPTDIIEDFLKETETWETVDSRERNKPRWKDYEFIVGIIDTGDSVPWVAMEYMDGGGLDDRLETHPNGLPINEALWIGECICAGVEIAHTYGIAHLDLKPANVLFRESRSNRWNVPKIADWGLARVLAEQTGTTDGLSVQYAAPEQFEPREFGDPDSLTDIHQVGAIMYEVLTGEPPYAGNVSSVMYDVVHGDDPDPPSSLRDDLSSAIDETILLALEQEKRDRFQNIGIFGKALQAIRTNTSLPPEVSERDDSSSGDKSYNNHETTDNVTVANPEATADSWPMFGGGPKRTGHKSTNEGGPEEGITTGWQFYTGDKVRSSPAVANNTVFVGSDDENLYAIDADSGDEKWVFETGDTVSSSPAVVNGTVFVGSGNYLYAVDSGTGSQQWTFETEGSIRSSPVVADGTVFFGSRDYSIYAVDANNGTKNWEYETNSRVSSSPAVGNGNLFIGSNDENLYAIDANTGNKEWHFETNNYILGAPVVGDDNVFVGSKDDHMYAIDASTGTKQWEFDTESQLLTSPAIGNGTVIFGAYDDSIYAIDADSGVQQWVADKASYLKSSLPAVVNGTVYINSGRTSISAINAFTGDELWEFEIGDQVESSPAVADGTIFIGSNDGGIYALSDSN